MHTTENEQMIWIEKLMAQGIFKYGDRQLYELSTEELMHLSDQSESIDN
ncbi:Fur-regulated basic protein FbpA [Domibacillus sp. DTU_2020_1001157_1_SI_ALB_TIR_016]|nr:Fur-regulated basic protein FbpA [Domibacillus sp. DTU_2020_1001157_1_SI_ALB_TIR_016]WNS80442.1 Fur-regulated basic protein FbpA [Domibacillus sp. DTU_2020_1001157_1_SI_ALB_TIR_016]